MPKCSTGLGSGTLCRLALDDIRPTQYSVGKHVAACKAKKIKKWDGQKGIKSLKNRLLMSTPLVPAVMGPGRSKKEGTGFYITDHHHLSYAIPSLACPLAGDDVHRTSTCLLLALS